MATTLSSGVYAVSNALLDTPWPKVAKGKGELQSILGQKDLAPALLLPILSDINVHPDEQLPETGVGLEWERMLSPIKIVSPKYGTRVSTVILVDRENRVTYYERTYPDNSDHSYEFEIS
jgi:uncharacterized protein with NRDE domain